MCLRARALLDFSPVIVGIDTRITDISIRERCNIRADYSIAREYEILRISVNGDSLMSGAPNLPSEIL